MMAATMENQVHQHDDLNLMGLQELDSHLSIFESSVFRGESTPGAMSTSTIEDADQKSQTIVVDTSSDQYLQRNHYGLDSPSIFTEQGVTNGIRYVPLALTRLIHLSFKFQVSSSV
jgi:hypothetical protein